MDNRFPMTRLYAICFALVTSILPNVSFASKNACDYKKVSDRTHKVMMFQMYAQLAYGQLQQLHKRQKSLAQQIKWLARAEKQHSKSASQKVALALANLKKLQASYKQSYTTYQSNALLEYNVAIAALEAWLAEYDQCRPLWFPKGDSKAMIEQEQKKVQQEFSEVSKTMAAAFRTPGKSQVMIKAAQNKLRHLQQQSVILTFAALARQMRKNHKQLTRQRQQLQALK